MNKQRVTHWTIGVLGSIVLIFFAAYGILHSRPFQQYVISKLVTATNEATGGRAEIQRFEFTPSTLTAALSGVTVRGKEAPSDPPLLHVDRLVVRLKPQALFHGNVTLRELLIEHPVAHLQVNPQGQSNLPQPAAKSSNSQSNVFDLAVGHTLLSAGELYLDDKAVPLNADLYDLKVDFHFDPATTRYIGEIGYGRGQVGYLQYPPLAHSLSAKLNMGPSALTLDSAVFRLGNSSAEVRAELADYSHPRMNAQYNVRIHADDLKSIATQNAPSGDLSLAGTVRYAAENRPWIQNVTLDGSIASSGLSATASQARVELRSLSGTYKLENGVFRTRDLKTQAFGGQLLADVQAEHLDAQPSYRVHAIARDLSMQEAQRMLHTQTGKIVLLGRADATLDASSAGSLKSTSAHALLRLRNELRNAAASQVSSVPVTGMADVSYDGARQTYIFRSVNLNVPSATLTAAGQLSRSSDLRINARATDLQQLAKLVASLQTPDQAQLTDVNGTATLNARVQGPMEQPHLTGQLQAQDLRVRGSDWSRVTASFKADPSQFAIENAGLVSAHQGTASFSGTVGLRRWSYAAANPISGRLSVRQMSIADLQRLGTSNYPVDGDLSADASIHGSQLDPVGSGTLKVVHGRAYGENIDHLAVDFNAAQGKIQSTLKMAAAPGLVNADLSYVPKSKSYTFRLDAPSLLLQKLRTLQAKNLDLVGVVSASGNGQGTIDDPQLVATLQLTQLKLRQKPYSDIKADLQVKQQRAELSLHSQVQNALIQAQGNMNLTGDQQVQVKFDTGTISLGPLLSSFMPSIPDEFDGQLELHGDLKGPLKNKSQMEGNLNVPVLRAHYQSLQIGAAQPLRAKYSGSVLTVEPTEIQGTGTSLKIQGNLPFQGTRPATLTAKGTIDAQILRIVRPDLRSSGTVALDIRSSGSGKAWGTQGQVKLQNIGITNPTGPLGIEKLDGVLDVTGEKVQISHMVGQVGGGQVDVGGSVTYRPQVQFNVAVKAKSVRLRYPEGVRTLLGGNVNLTGSTQEAVLGGRVLVESLSFTPDFDLAKLGDQFEGNVPSQPGFADNIKLQLTVQSSGQLSATSSQVSLEGRLNLQAIGTAANPVIIGRTDLTGGELFYRNVRYQLQRGIITFDDPNQTNPVMNVAVTTTVQQYNLTLTMRGPLNKLVTSYASEPPLATADIINLLARGRTTQETEAATQGTDALIASQAASQVSSSVQKVAGLSSLQIDPLIGGNGHNPSARVAMQQRVTKNFLFTFSTDVSQPGSEMVQGDYKISRRWSVSVARDQLGGVSMDGKFHTTF